MGIDNDFIPYPLRKLEKELLCVCMHDKGKHANDNSCMVCMCEEYSESKMNKEIPYAIEKAKKDAIKKFTIISNSTPNKFIKTGETFNEG